MRNSSSAWLLLICPQEVATNQFVLVAHVLCHKGAALDRLIDQFGAYICQLVSLAEDSKVL